MATPKRVRPKPMVGKDDRYDNSKFFLEHGVDLEKRTISIYQDIDEDSAAYLRRGIKKMLEVDPELAIDVEIMSEGGDAYAGLAMHDAIKYCSCLVRTHAHGVVGSAAFDVYLAGDERYAYENISFMAHSASSRTWGKQFEQQVDLDELKALNNRSHKIYAEVTYKDANWWKRKLATHDYWFDYEMAVELGVITHEIED